MNDLVSIIMPSYNTGGYIRQSIDSVLKQSYQNWELIIIDDCSTDNTIEILDTIKDSRLKVLRNKCNSGAAICRNRGLRLASGRWIAFLDSDDIWSPLKLEKQISFMEQNGYSFSYTEYEEIDTCGNLLNIIVSGPKRINKHRMYNYCWPGCLTVMYDKDIVGLIQIENIKKNNDYAMWLKVVKQVDCFLLEECLAQYRRGREGSISTNSVFKLIKWHYYLYRYSESQSIIVCLFNTLRNVICGVYKKVKYVRRIGKNENNRNTT